jgi:hypothetical protein
MGQGKGINLNVRPSLLVWIYPFIFLPSVFSSEKKKKKDVWIRITRCALSLKLLLEDSFGSIDTVS